MDWQLFAAMWELELLLAALGYLPFLLVRILRNTGRLR